MPRELQSESTIGVLHMNNSSSKTKRNSQILDDDPLWYKHAVVYEVHVKCFYDSNGDGIGDFQGLCQKLDYIQDLGITAIWLLPFYPSPLRDDGYDIADYKNVHPSYGTIDDFRHFLSEAHKRGLRVITELVINHTSDQHPWFQKARHAPKDSPERNFYVWSDDSSKYSEARIIFTDTETSNWTWDPVAKQFFWHRFFSHQPDLNFANKHVHDAIFEIADFWLKMGVDGLRLDAIPYLYESPGSTCENLPETHQFLRKFRRHVDYNYKNRMLLAEANQWPEESCTYFGAGPEASECHMSFHFPLMPRLWHAIKSHDTYPILDILEQTPEIPPECQWAIFLRNHDELTLEMVTDEERDFMYRTYARDPKHRINVGIRRRLAPLLGNNMSEIKLLHALLLFLPGTPFLYYGDELCMGDNCDLPDRDGVRTPMQWNSKKNAGFSTADKLYLPVVASLQYNYQYVNVENSLQNLSSFYWWLKRMIAARKRHVSVFGSGDISFLETNSNSTLAFLRTFSSEILLMVFNFSTSAGYVSLDLSNFNGYRMSDIFGNSEFPPIGSTPYFLSFTPQSFYALKINPPEFVAPLDKNFSPLIEISGGEEFLFIGNSRTALETCLLRYISHQKWFPEKHTIERVMITDVIPADRTERKFYFVLLQALFGESEKETFLVPVGIYFGALAREIEKKHPEMIIGSVAKVKSALLKTPMIVRNTSRRTSRDVHPREQESALKELAPPTQFTSRISDEFLSPLEIIEEGVVFDCSYDSDFVNLIFMATIGKSESRGGERGTVFSEHLPHTNFSQIEPQKKQEYNIIESKGGYTIIGYSDKFFIRILRQIGSPKVMGVHPDFEIRVRLTEHVHTSEQSSGENNGNNNGNNGANNYLDIPHIHGSLHYRGTGLERPVTLVIVEDALHPESNLRNIFTKEILPKYFKLSHDKLQVIQQKLSNFKPKDTDAQHPQLRENAVDFIFDNCEKIPEISSIFGEIPELSELLDKSLNIAKAMAFAISELHSTLSIEIGNPQQQLQQQLQLQQRQQLQQQHQQQQATYKSTSVIDNYESIVTMFNLDPQPVNSLYLRALYQSLRNTIRISFIKIRNCINNNTNKNIPEKLSSKLSAALDREKDILRKLKELLTRQSNSEETTSLRIRIHGDLSLEHIGVPRNFINQIGNPKLSDNSSAQTPSDKPASAQTSTHPKLILSDFSGKQTLTLSERRIMQTPLKDVASLFCSFNDALCLSLSSFLQQEKIDGENEKILRNLGNFWVQWMCQHFFRSYCDNIQKHEKKIITSTTQSVKQGTTKTTITSTSTTICNKQIIPITLNGCSLLLNIMVLESVVVELCCKIQYFDINSAEMLVEKLEKWLEYKHK